MNREDSELLHGLVEVAKGGRKFPWYDLRAPFIFFFSTWQTDYPLPPPIYFLVRFVLISSSIEQDLYIQKCLYNKHYFFLNSHRVWIYKISFPFLKKSFVTSLSCVPWQPNHPRPWRYERVERMHSPALKIIQRICCITEPFQCQEKKKSFSCLCWRMQTWHIKLAYSLFHTFRLKLYKLKKKKGGGGVEEKWIFQVCFFAGWRWRKQKSKLIQYKKKKKGEDMLCDAWSMVSGTARL